MIMPRSNETPETLDSYMELPVTEPHNIKHYAYDADRGEMFEIAHGAYVLTRDHEKIHDDLQAARHRASQDAETELAARNVAESKLAAAEALLDRIYHKASLGPIYEWIDEYRRSAAQPKTHQYVTFTTVQGQTLSSCTMLDIEALKEANSIPTRTLQNCDTLSEYAGFARAELARRL